MKNEANSNSSISDAEARTWHAKLFPEEYDFVYDSSADAQDRRRGVNPMSAEYIEKANARRAELGFGPYEICRQDLATFDWVADKLRKGKAEELQAILDRRASEDMA
ncbi:MAG: hypothetical protein R8G60_03420 [Roseovarius pacificus]|nr:hypothetical protein [Roseovarius pacificus]